MRILTSARKRNVPFSTQTFDMSATREADQIEKWLSTKSQMHNVSMQGLRILTYAPAQHKPKASTNELCQNSQS